MSDRDLLRVNVLSRLVSGELTSEESAELLAVSVRQVKRLKRRYVEGGAKSIRHALLSRPSNRSRSSEERDRALEIVRSSYGGSVEKGAHQRFGPTLAAEQLLEDEGLEIPVSTLRRWMIEARLWSKHRRVRPRFRRRDRKEHFGELLQLDLRHDMPERARVIVRTTEEDDSLRVIYKTRSGTEHELTWRDYRKRAPAPKRIGLSEKAITAHKARHPAANHPWRNKDYLEAKAAFDERRRLAAALIPTEVP